MMSVKSGKQNFHLYQDTIAIKDPLAEKRLFLPYRYLRIIAHQRAILSNVISEAET